MNNHDALVEKARQAAANSYSPYSGFRVGAALVAGDGSVFYGANVENAAYPVSNCAEATAVNTAAAAGVRKIQTVAVACIDAASIDGAYPVRALSTGDERVRSGDGAGRDRRRPPSCPCPLRVAALRVFRWDSPR